MKYYEYRGESLYTEEDSFGVPEIPNLNSSYIEDEEIPTHMSGFIPGDQPTLRVNAYQLAKIATSLGEEWNTDPKSFLVPGTPVHDDALNIIHNPHKCL